MSIAYVTYFSIILVDGNYGAWQNVSGCIPSCGSGVFTQQRFCNNPQPRFGGRTCQQQGLGAAQRTLPCNRGSCASKLRVKANLCQRQEHSCIGLLHQHQSDFPRGLLFIMHGQISVKRIVELIMQSSWLLLVVDFNLCIN